MDVEHIGDVTIYTGDVLEVLRMLPDESVHCVVTSPPYWGLRDYGVDGQIGLEKTPEEYVSKMVEVFRAVRRILRKDGTCWVNLGDSYANDGKWGGETGGKQAYLDANNRRRVGREKRITGLKPKDLVGIPWRVAFALQSDGWYLRSDIIWHKPNPMPESVTDRPTKAHEYVFLLSKSPRYFYDAEAVREAGESGPSDIRKMEEGLDRIGGKHKVLIDPLAAASSTTHIGQVRAVGTPGGRNRRTVWTIATEPYPEAHFATFPRKLVQPCILAGCPEHACPKCGAPWVREVEKSGGTIGKSWHDHKDDKNTGMSQVHASITDKEVTPYQVRIIGEHPTCTCGLPSIGGTVLDPFGGSGTTAEVALEYGRRAILIELKPEYVELIRGRLRPVVGRPLLNFTGGQHAISKTEKK